MFTISNVVVGTVISREKLEELIRESSFQSNGESQVVGDLLYWSNLNQVKNIHHMDLAPENTIVYIKEHYFGIVTIIKNSNKWYVTNIETNGKG